MKLKHGTPYTASEVLLYVYVPEAEIHTWIVATWEDLHGWIVAATGTPISQGVRFWGSGQSGAHVEPKGWVHLPIVDSME